MYLHGAGGVAKDKFEAVEWFRKAVEQGHAEAQVQLGEMYLNGFGVPKAEGEGVKLFARLLTKVMHTDNAFCLTCITMASAYQKMRSRERSGCRELLTQGT